MNKPKKSYWYAMVTCGAPSLAGVLVFLFPISYKEKKTTLVAHIATAIEGATGGFCVKALLLTFLISACLPVVVKTTKKPVKIYIHHRV